MSGLACASGLDNAISEVLNPTRDKADIWLYGWLAVWLLGLLICSPFFISCLRKYRRKERWFLKTVLGVIIFAIVEAIASVIYLVALTVFALI